MHFRLCSQTARISQTERYLFPVQLPGGRLPFDVVTEEVQPRRQTIKHTPSHAGKPSYTYIHTPRPCDPDPASHAEEVDPTHFTHKGEPKVWPLLDGAVNVYD